MITENNGLFVLSSENTTYAFKVLHTGHLQHFYYGSRLNAADLDSDATSVLSEKHAFAPGNTVTYDAAHPEFSLEDMALEMSSYGKGDIREPYVSIIMPDGSRTSDFLYDSFRIIEGKPALSELPSARADNEAEAQTLEITLKDKERALSLILTYSVFEKCDVITRSSRLVNESSEAITVTRLMSGFIDLDDADYDIVSFSGSWGNEMNRRISKVNAGKMVMEVHCGVSSSRMNPFFMLKKPDCSEDNGKAYGFNLIYSGDHYAAVETSPYGKLRVVNGVSPTEFCYKLEAGEFFQAPEAVMSYSDKGMNELSHHFHGFVNNHIVRSPWRSRKRPVLLNSWEARYFKINESVLLKLAKKAAATGIELFVMDDGWFKGRCDDKRALGDWSVDTKKFPHGLNWFSRKIADMGMQFGIWLEPEMISVDSDLYRAHPDFAMAIPHMSHSEGRNQRVLDLANTKVQDYIINAVSAVLDSAKISYVKWDMNRIFSDYFSPSMSADNQGHVCYSYYLGLYRVLDTLMNKYPEVLFEGCASGGNRFDLGMLCYFPQIWASDNTDAVCRLSIQNGYSYGYPQSCMGCHVSSAINHQTLRKTPLSSRFNVAAFGSLGYELNLSDLPKEVLKETASQIRLYKELREVLQYGTLNRLRDGNTFSWCAVSPDKKTAVAMIFKILKEPGHEHDTLMLKGLDENTIYVLKNTQMKYNIKDFGDLVNTVAPIHVKPDSALHNLLAKFIKIDGEKDDFTASGRLLMNAGLKLAPEFAATGLADNMRIGNDFSSMLYILKAKE